MAEKKSSKAKSAAKPYPKTAHQPAGKVAEDVATYVVRSTPKPRAAARASAGLAADDEVWAFVKANNLMSSLETAIRSVRETFPTLQEIKLAYEPDPELPFFDAVVIYAKAVGEVETLFDQERRYVQTFGRNIPYEDSHKIVMLLGVA